MGHLLTGGSSWTPKTQPNDALRRRLLSFWCSTRPSADAGNQVCGVLPKVAHYVVSYLHLLKAELNTKNSTKRCRTTFSASGDTLFFKLIELNTRNSTKRHLTALCFLEFLVFNSAFSRWLPLKNAYCIMTIIHCLRSLKKALSKLSQFPKNSLEYTQWNVNLLGMLSWNLFQRSQKIYYGDYVIGTIKWPPFAEGPVEY